MATLRQLQRRKKIRKSKRYVTSYYGGDSDTRIRSSTSRRKWALKQVKRRIIDGVEPDPKPYIPPDTPEEAYDRAMRGI